jgi:hypothetical protein
MEIASAILTAILMAIVYYFLESIGLINSNEFYLTIIITIATTLATVATTVLVVKLVKH